MRRVLLASLVFFLSLGCSDSSDRIQLAEWRLSRELTIGSIDDPQQSLTTVGDLTVDQAGNLYLTQPMDQSIRVYSPEGILLREMGKAGGGPGEFLSISEMGWLADTLYVTDARNGRVTLFMKDGTVARTLPFKWTPSDDRYSRGVVRRLLPDHSLLVDLGSPSQSRSDGTVTARPILRIDSIGTERGKLAEVSLKNTQLHISQGDGQLFTSQLFSDSPVVDLSPAGDYIIVLDREVSEAVSLSTMRVTKISSEGDTLYCRDIPYEPIPLQPEVVDSVVGLTAEALATLPMFGSVREARRALEQAAYVPNFLPPATQIVATSNGNIWIQREDHRGAEITWDALSPEGIPMGFLTLPRNSRVLDSRQGLLWVQEFDEWDVPYVVRYRIEK